ncbi:lysosomal proton-coupled steroid conjugate and bile acid symporter SLC46A3-like [Pleurodeles waltl]|uniref:lysosomal proton-coupled steroid conjugate and bile acid symporter SLC46A3-like n=1 Tax=Pleurodeles waltl TaxID=8319 RepID=UPI0037099450
MKTFALIEPVVALYCFASYLTFPLLQQYIYQRLWQDTTNTNFSGNLMPNECETNISSPLYMDQKEVQQKASMFSMMMDLSGLIPGLLVTLVIVAYGDRHGRKTSLWLPSLGGFVTSAFYFAISYFSWPLYILYISAVLTGFLGRFGTFLGGCFAYAADISHGSKQRTLRIALIDMILGVSSGLAGIVSGYLIESVGFAWLFVTTCVLHFFNMVYIIFFLEETVKISESQTNAFSAEGFKEIFAGVCLLFKNASCRKRSLIISMLFAFMSYSFGQFGAFSIFTLYELGSPLCWDAVLIGWGSSLNTVVFVTSFLGVFLFTKCLKEPYIIFIGLFSWTSGMLMSGFAKTTLLMFLVRVVIVFAFMPLPIFRSMMSKVVLDSEQGALFGCIACLESLTATVSGVVFSCVYATTVMWLPGFSFLLAAGLVLIPMSLVWAIMLIGYEEEQPHTLFINEVESDGGDLLS